MVPVLPKGELEVLLEAAIDLCKKGRFPSLEASEMFLHFPYESHSSLKKNNFNNKFIV